ncbi:hypothetical protein AJ80_04648 [Polytolypa hystricis UAMH7299]|uniref:Uncharacterized protein n=1 Tax=Polytolypa hystricis (strain UAMH7299) TaxID=1447883 RepID=A0A2B7Y999_POLH7|nr:hypothetical protein AJ80_04648 [Polytolypa hystricis UAMH7299]
MSFCQLTNELVLELADCMKDCDVNTLARTCHTLHRLLNPYLYRRDAKHGGCSALGWAEYQLKTTTAQLALNAGADVNQVGMGRLPLVERTPLGTAVYWYPPVYPIKPVLDHLPMIRLLLENGAKLGMHEAQALLQVAGEKRLTELVRLVFNHSAHLDLKDTQTAPFEMNAEYIMHAASRGGSAEVLQMLLDYGFPVSGVPLHLVINKPNIAAAHFLLERGADVNATHDFRGTPLRYMLCNKFQKGQGDLEIVRLLVKHGADLNSEPLLLIAVRCEDDSLIAYLVESGANVHWRSYDGSTLLHQAINDIEHHILKLADLGVDLEAKDGRGKTILHRAVDRSCHIRRLSSLLQLPVDVNSRTREGETALHLAACGNRNPKRARMLVKAGANVDALRTSDGFTALHLATRNKHTNMVRELLSLGADVNIHDHDGKTPLDIARESQRRYRESAKIERLLLAADMERSKQFQSNIVRDTMKAVTRLQATKMGKTSTRATAASALSRVRRSERLRGKVV